LDGLAPVEYIVRVDTPAKMLVYTGDADLMGQLGELLEGTGVDLQGLARADELEDRFGSAPPELALIDTSVGFEESMRVCTSLRGWASAERLAVLVLVDELDDASLSALIAAGADGLVSRSLKPLSFRTRVAAHLERIAAGRTLALKVRDSELLIDVTSRLVGSPDVLENLYEVAMVIARELEVSRCSVVLVRPQRDFGLVVASSDDPSLRSLAINLSRYPEIMRAVERSSPLIINDVADSELLGDVLPDLEDAGVASVALFPISRRGETVGVIFLRFFSRRDEFEERETIFCQTVANAASIALRNAEIFELLKAKTREVEKVATEARVREESLKRYEDFFLGAVDGMVALEQSGRVVFANPRAAEMIGREVSSLVGKPFADFVAARERAEFEKLLAEFVAGESRRRVDFFFGEEVKDLKVVSISAGALFDEQGMLLLSLRDVTEEREMERRLARAQQQLVQSEKQAAMAQLAGAAAHELNQPLTSVMTSLAMLRRLIEGGGKEARVIETMEQEAERMAEIIRRLTKITNYTTKDYVGEAKIIDLASACDDDAAGGGEGNR
jgi:PAS domain S-box-containing protein